MGNLQSRSRLEPSDKRSASICEATNAVMRGETMRDILGDLQERVTLIREDITRTNAQYETAIRRLKGECDGRVAALKAELAALGAFFKTAHQRPPGPRPMQHSQSLISDGPRHIQSEQQRIWNNSRPIESERHRNGSLPTSPPRQSLSDFLTRKLAETGPSSSDDLSNFATQEGYFPDTEHARPGVQATLVELLSGNRISALRDGRLAPATRS